MAICRTCKSSNLIHISAHARDCFDVFYQESGLDHSGYFPENMPELGSGDDMEITLCGSCGRCQELGI